VLLPGSVCACQAGARWHPLEALRRGRYRGRPGRYFATTHMASAWGRAGAGAGYGGGGNAQACDEQRQQHLQQPCGSRPLLLLPWRAYEPSSAHRPRHTGATPAPFGPAPFAGVSLSLPTLGGSVAGPALGPGSGAGTGTGVGAGAGAGVGVGVGVGARAGPGVKVQPQVHQWVSREPPSGWQGGRFAPLTAAERFRSGARRATRPPRASPPGGPGLGLGPPQARVRRCAARPRRSRRAHGAPGKDKGVWLTAVRPLSDWELVISPDAVLASMPPLLPLLLQCPPRASLSVHAASAASPHSPFGPLTSSVSMPRPSLSTPLQAQSLPLSPCVRGTSLSTALAAPVPMPVPLPVPVQMVGLVGGWWAGRDARGPGMRLEGGLTSTFSPQGPGGAGASSTTYLGPAQSGASAGSRDVPRSAGGAPRWDWAEASLYPLSPPRSSPSTSASASYLPSTPFSAAASLNGKGDPAGRQSGPCELSPRGVPPRVGSLRASGAPGAAPGAPASSPPWGAALLDPGEMAWQTVGRGGSGIRVAHPAACGTPPGEPGPCHGGRGCCREVGASPWVRRWVGR